MRRFIILQGILVLLAALAMTPNAVAQNASIARPSANIAAGVSYTLDPAPNYELCTDPGDAKQLTDGVYTQGYFWAQKSTVGWSGKNPIVVTLDLGADKPIRGASFNTAAGVAGVAWPAAISVLVAGEDKQFAEVTDLVLADAKHGMPPAEGYAVHRFWTDELKTHGRYVAFVFSAAPYAFVDEIEVYEGQPDWVNAPIEGTRFKDIKEHVKLTQLRGAIQRRIRWDIEAVSKKIGVLTASDEIKKALIAELDAVGAEVNALRPDWGADSTTILPINPLEERVLRTQAKLWQAQGRSALTLWQSPLWDALSHAADPPANASVAVEAAMMQNEYRAGAFNISNATQAPVAIRLRITGLPGGDNPNYVTVHETTWTDTKRGEPVVAALPPATLKDGVYSFLALPGLTRQVWFTFHPTDIEPATHKGVVEVVAVPTGGAEERHEVPLTLKVYPIRFPDKPTLHLGGWDYTNGNGNRGITPETMTAVIAHMREHFVDSPWATSGVMPAGTYDDQGAMTAEPDVTAFDEWHNRWPGCGQYMVFSSVGNTFAQFTMDTPPFEAAVKAWAAFWADHVKKLGIQPDQVALLLVDEPSKPDQDAVILAWAKAIRSADTGIRIWEDPIYANDMMQANQAMIAACHVLCPNRPLFLSSPQAYRDYFVQQRDKGITLEFYSCSGPGRLLDPYSYERLQAWECWKYQAHAMYFWAFSDTGGGSSWDEYGAPGTDYCPFFLSPTTVTAGKHMEAIREGIEDFEYLVMLRDAIAQAEKAGKTGDALNKAKALLAEVPERVLQAGTTTGFWWKDEMDRTVADKARVEILEALVALKG